VTLGLISCALLVTESVSNPISKVKTKKQGTFLKSLSLITGPHQTCSYHSRN